MKLITLTTPRKVITILTYNPWWKDDPNFSYKTPFLDM